MNLFVCNRGKESLVQRLKDAGIRDTEEYISFFGLRNHSVLQGGMVSIMSLVAISLKNWMENI